jgi:hypothetical protein
MRDESHIEQVDRWAEYVKSNPREWKNQLRPFIDSQLLIANRFYSKLPEDKVKELRK